MNLSQSTRIPGVIEQMIYARFPGRIKRLMYVSSIFGIIVGNIDVLDLELIRKLNEIIHLSKDSRSYQFPIYIRRSIWRNTNFQNLQLSDEEIVSIADVMECDLNHEQCNKIGKAFAVAAPSWLKYGTFEDMVKDVVNLIHAVKKMRVSHAFDMKPRMI